jgi:hypothetical protein
MTVNHYRVLFRPSVAKGKPTVAHVLAIDFTEAATLAAALHGDLRVMNIQRAEAIDAYGPAVIALLKAM